MRSSRGGSSYNRGVTSKPPTRLSASARALWTGVTARWELRPDEMRILEDACREATLVDKIEAALKAADLVTDGSTGQVRAHPLLSEVRQHRVAMTSLLARLALPDDEADGRQDAARSEHARSAAIARWGQVG